MSDMSRPIIEVENISKRYRLGQYNAQTMREEVENLFLRFRRNGKDASVPGMSAKNPEFLALRDVSFSVQTGEVVGIIGRNGAGKSTLLKLLSRVTEPTSGQIRIRGRVASLLEVGTGFHPDLTGRENVYLNGAILGMTRVEMRRKFDEIVAFADVEKFLETPVKRYSSGMYVRLAFAVAAHLEPEILIVDEVLAVGDTEFQRKCLGKMRDVAGQGRTVLFVSHSMAAVKALCTRGLLLAEGCIVSQGAVGTVISEYSNSSTQAHSIAFAVDPKRPSIYEVNVDREALVSRDFVVHIAFVSPWPLQVAVGGILLRSVGGEPVWGSNGRFHTYHEQLRGVTGGVLRCETRSLPITPGQYLLSVWLGDWHEDYDSKLDVLSIFIGDDRVNPLQPPSSLNGHLDWPAAWGPASVMAESVP